MSDFRDNPSTRRDFGKTLAALAATGGMAAAQEKEQEKPKPAEPAGTIPDALLEVIQLKYGKFLTPEQLQSLKRTLNRHQAMANRLKQVKLKNGDEPAFVFSAEVK
jgi:hypothetical protein